jgi:Holliday junction resolvase RusA-like endonuclease
MLLLFSVSFYFSSFISTLISIDTYLSSVLMPVEYYASADDELLQMMDAHGFVNSLEVSVSGDPRALARPRMVWRGVNRPYMFNPDSAHLRQFRQALLAVTGAQTVPIFPRNSYLRLNVLFQIPRPSSHYTRQGRLKPNTPCFPTDSDLDNYIKFVMDGMQGVVIHDDRNIVIVCAAKVYAEQERIGRTYMWITSHF